MKTNEIIKKIFSLIDEIEKKSNDSEIRKFYIESKLKSDTETENIDVQRLQNFPNEDLKKFFNLKNRNEPIQ
jgi:hypothetical protein